MPRRHLPSLLVVVLLVSGCTSNTPEGVAERYWAAVIAKDQQTIEQTIVESSSPSLSKAIQPNPESSVEFGETLRAGGNMQEDENATVDTRFHWVEDGETTVLQLDTVLVYQDGAWRVDPVKTRQEFFDSVYRSALTGLEAALEESAQTFREMGSSLSESMARELSAASRELQKQSEKANKEIQEFLEKLDEDLQKELEKRQ